MFWGVSCMPVLGCAVCWGLELAQD
jgi:hypothetical protein